MHPLVAHRRSELIAAAADDAVIVEDIPLLVESGMAPMFPLVVIVHADEDARVKRLIEYRGFTEQDARARIAAQATEEQRRAVADVWLDNRAAPASSSGKPVSCGISGYCRSRTTWTTDNPRASQPVLVPYDPVWPDQARRIAARLNTACGHRAVRIDHIGSTAVPGVDAKDVIDMQVTVASLEVADELAEALASVGYVHRPITADVPKPDARSTVATFDHTNDESLWHKRLHCSADPGRPTNVHVRVDGWPGQQFALLFVDWLRANPSVQADYLALKRRVVAEAHADTGAYADAKEPWFLDAYRRAWEWADTTGWRP